MKDDIFFTRRSVRKYIKGKEIEDEKLEYILKAAMFAPSANNRRNWEFIIVKNRDSFNKIMEFHPYAKMLETAPMCIIVCGDLSDESGKLFWQQNCSAAIENLMLAAKAKDLGTVWVAIAPVEDRMNKTIEIFNIPEHIKPLGLIAIGYPDEEHKNPDRFEPNKIHYEKF